MQAFLFFALLAAMRLLNGLCINLSMFFFNKEEVSEMKAFHTVYHGVAKTLVCLTFLCLSCECFSPFHCANAQDSFESSSLPVFDQEEADLATLDYSSIYYTNNFDLYQDGLEPLKLENVTITEDTSLCELRWLGVEVTLSDIPSNCPGTVDDFGILVLDSQGDTLFMADAFIERNLSGALPIGGREFNVYEYDIVSMNSSETLPPGDYFIGIYGKHLSTDGCAFGWLNTIIGDGFFLMLSDDGSYSEIADNLALYFDAADSHEDKEETQAGSNNRNSACTLDHSGEGSLRDYLAQSSDCATVLDGIPSTVGDTDFFENRRTQGSASGEKSSDAGTWEKKVENAGWSAREGHASLVFNQKMWVFGGFSRGSRNDVWSSSNGVEWTKETASAGWQARQSHAATVFDNKMWILGGYSGSVLDVAPLNDVWSSPDGVVWTMNTSSAGWSTRGNHMSLVFKNKIWVIGGSGLNGAVRKDIWCSPDGMAWTQTVSSSDWLGGVWRSTALVFDDKMWIIAGPKDETSVWYSSDGVSWTQAISSAAWPGRSEHASVVFDNKMWVLGGSGHDPRYLNDVWHSSDGVTWTQSPSYVGWSARQNHSSVVFDKKIWVLGGEDDSYDGLNDVWAYSPEIPPAEGEDDLPVEGEPEKSGCNSEGEKTLVAPRSMERLLGEWLLVGLTLLAFVGLPTLPR